MTFHAHFGLTQPPDNAHDDDHIQNDCVFNTRFYYRENHPDIYIVDECSMMDEILWGHLHDVHWMFPDIKFVFLFDINQCPPVPAHNGYQSAFGAKGEETLIEYCPFIAREMFTHWINFTLPHRSTDKELHQVCDFILEHKKLPQLNREAGVSDLFQSSKSFAGPIKHILQFLFIDDFLLKIPRLIRNGGDILLSEYVLFHFQSL